MNKNRKLILGIVALVLITAVVTFMASAYVFSRENTLYPKYEIAFDPQNVSQENVKKFNQVRDILKQSYYENVDENTLLEGAIAGMAYSLKDPYTVYFTKDQMKLFMEKSTGSYVGIGVTVIMDNNGLLTVVEPFYDSPAYKSGIMAGDKIIKVNDTDVSNIRDEDIIIKMIKGEENTKVKITVYRPEEGKPLDFEMLRKKIKTINLKSEVLPDHIGYIKIGMFDSEIAHYFKEALSNLLAQDIKSLIIDVRDNPGGDYDQVVEIADMLLPQGLIVYTQDKYGRKVEEKSDKKELGMPLTILVNGNSASASEVLSGAIKDHKKGKLIGTRTFGKGLVQVVVPLDDGSGIKVTIARYFTPSGVCIQGIGIQPDEEVEVYEKYRNMPASQIPRGDDIQLKTAVEVLKAQIK